MSERKTPADRLAEALVWESPSPSNMHIDSAYTPIGNYTVELDNGEYFARFEGWGEDEHIDISIDEPNSLENEMKKCQTHYDNLVSACVSSQALTDYRASKVEDDGQSGEAQGVGFFENISRASDDKLVNSLRTVMNNYISGNNVDAKSIVSEAIARLNGDTPPQSVEDDELEDDLAEALEISRGICEVLENAS